MINLSTDKQAVFTETFQVLKPGGRIGVSDVADDHLTPNQRAERAERGDCVGTGPLIGRPVLRIAGRARCTGSL